MALAAGAQAGTPVLGDLMQMNQARINRRFQARQYQVTVDDMRKAGLNPALAYGNGPEKLSPVMPDIQDPGKNVGPAMGTYFSGKQLELERQRVANETQRVANETAAVKADIALKGGQLGNLQLQPPLILGQTEAAHAAARFSGSAAELNRLKVPEVQTTSEIYRAILPVLVPILQALSKIGKDAVAGPPESLPDKLGRYLTGEAKKTWDKVVEGAPRRGDWFKDSKIVRGYEKVMGFTVEDLGKWLQKVFLENERSSSSAPRIEMMPSH